MKKYYLLFKFIQFALIALGWAGIIAGAYFLASKDRALGFELLLPGFGIYAVSYLVGYFYLEYKPGNKRSFVLVQILRLLAECLGFTGLAVGVFCFFMGDFYDGVWFAVPGLLLFILSFVFERFYSDN